jgi:hypothetical protein
MSTTSTAAAAATATTATNAATQSQDVLPSPQTLLQAAKLAITRDMPIQMDYYVDTTNGKAFMGEEKETKDKMLVKSAVEYTSHIDKIYKVAEDYIVLTANSIYIVSGKIQKRQIESSSLRSGDDEDM